MNPTQSSPTEESLFNYLGVKSSHKDSDSLFNETESSCSSDSFSIHSGSENGNVIEEEDSVKEVAVCSWKAVTCT